MRVIQTTITEAKHKLLEQYARKNSMTFKRSFVKQLKQRWKVALTLTILFLLVHQASNRQERKTVAPRNTIVASMGKKLG